jgi:hypothetical protein
MNTVNQHAVSQNQSYDMKWFRSPYSLFQMVLWRTSGPKRGEWWKAKESCRMQSFIICHPSPNITRIIKSRRIKLAEHASWFGAFRNTSNILIRKPEGKRSLGKTYMKREDNIKIISQASRWKVLNGFSWLMIRTSWWALFHKYSYTVYLIH